MRTWGEAGVVTLRDRKKSKIQDKGTTCIVGYALDHTGDCYRMYNPETSKIHLTRDIKWLNRMYFKSARFHTAENLLTIKAGKECSSEITPFMIQNIKIQAIQMIPVQLTHHLYNPPILNV